MIAEKNSQKENNKKNSIESKENKRISENSHHERRRNMKMFEDIAMGEIWFVDAKTGDIIQGHNYSDAPTSYRSLPPNAENAIKESLNGRVNTTENFNEFLDNKSITVAAPIFSKKDNSIVGAVLLHAPVSDISDSLKSGIYTLIISIIIALILSIISAVLLSLSFTKPLSKIRKTALLLKKGNYNVKTEVKQKDEIGELARTMDELSERLYISSKESERFEKMRSDFISVNTEIGIIPLVFLVIYTYVYSIIYTVALLGACLKLFFLNIKYENQASSRMSESSNSRN